MQNITETGLRGYIRWLQLDQPAIYAKAAPLIAQRYPQAFSDFEQSSAMGALFDTTGAAVPDSSDTSDSSGASTGTDVASAANSGAASPSIVAGIQSIVQAISAAYLTKQQADAYNQINQAQLQRAALGGNMLQISSTKQGIPLIAGIAPVQLSGSTIGWVAGGIAVLWLLSKMGKSHV